VQGALGSETAGLMERSLSFSGRRRRRSVARPLSQCEVDLEYLASTSESPWIARIGVFFVRTLAAPSRVLVCQSVLEIRVPELIERTSLSQDLPIQRTF
jgi:hypothetical protein